MFFPTIAGGAGVVDGLLQRREQVIELAADVDVGGVRADGVAADEAALHEQMGIALHQQVVLEGARFALVGVADDVFGIRRLLVDELPLEPGREAGAASATQARGLHLFDHLVGRHRERLLQAVVALLVLHVVLEGVAAGRVGVLGEHGLVVGGSRRTGGRRGLPRRVRARLDVEMAARERLDAVLAHAIEERRHLVGAGGTRASAGCSPSPPAPCRRRRGTPSAGW